MSFKKRQKEKEKMLVIKMKMPSFSDLPNFYSDEKIFQLNQSVNRQNNCSPC